MCWPLLSVRPLVLPAAVCPSQELRTEDERGGKGCPGSGQALSGVREAEARLLRLLLPPMLPIQRGARCPRGRVLGILATGAQRPPLAQRLSAGTQERAGHPPLGACESGGEESRAPSAPPPELAGGQRRRELAASIRPGHPGTAPGPGPACPRPAGAARSASA